MADAVAIFEASPIIKLQYAKKQAATKDADGLKPPFPRYLW
jgi:hypothetical protein